MADLFEPRHLIACMSVIMQSHSDLTVEIMINKLKLLKAMKKNLT